MRRFTGSLALSLGPPIPLSCLLFRVANQHEALLAVIYVVLVVDYDRLLVDLAGEFGLLVRELVIVVVAILDRRARRRSRRPTGRPTPRMARVHRLDLAAGPAVEARFPLEGLGVSPTVDPAGRR